MKNTILLFLLATGSALFFTNCQQDDDSPVLGEPFTIDYQFQKQVADGLSITFVAVTTDSRCPCEADCITAGQIGVKIKMEANGTALTKLFMLEGYDEIEGAVTETEFEGYNIKLTDVLPLPCGGEPDAPEDYSIEVLVSEL